MERRFVLPVVLVVTAGALILAPRPTQADPSYKIQSIAKLGDTIGGLKISTGASFGVSSLNDSGQLAFVALNAAGGDILFQYRDGQFTPIVVGGRDAPGGKWPRDVGVWTPVRTNELGDMVFQAGSGSNLNTYRWNRQSGQVSPVVAAGMPAVNDLTFKTSGDAKTPALNDFGEVAFQATIKDNAGKSQKALFFLGRDNKLVPVLLPGQTVDGVGPIQPSAEVGHLVLNNAGVLSFRARRPGDKYDSIFTWENGTITPVAMIGGDAPGGGKFVFLGSIGTVNNKNRNVLFAGNLDGNNAHWGLYGLIDGQLTAICVPGREMPGGGKFAGGEGASVPNSAGEIVWAGRLEGGDTGYYRADAEGKLSLIVRGTDLGGKIVDPNSNGMAINNKGQVALPVRFNGDKVDTLVLLTPVSP